MHAALITGAGQLELREFPDPVPSPAGAVVDISFCGICGAFLGEPDTNAEGGGFPIAASALDDDPGLRIVLHECVADKPAWLDLCDDAHQLQGPAEGNLEPGST